MRKIIVGEFISLDGVVEAPDQWHFPYVNDEMFAAMWAQNAESDTMLLGRHTYESFAGAFANAAVDDPVAAEMNRPTKVVVTSTLKELTWAKCVPLTGDVVEGITRLKQAAGSNILVVGSTRLVRTLLAVGLVDEISLFVHPIVVGTGQRLFDEGGARLPLTLVGSTTFSTGVVHLVYRKA
jgi:dihydrofolate reductase